MPLKDNPKSVGYVISCRTGCSCCSSENHDRGPFKMKETADKKIEEYRDGPLLASQYARRGRYSVREVEIETLPDGRIIVGGTLVLKGFAEDTGEEVMEEY